MSDYRDPKVTTSTGDKSSAGKWIGIAIAVIIAVILLAWLLGAFGGGEVATTPTVPGEVIAPPVD